MERLSEREKTGKFGSWVAEDTGTVCIYRLQSPQKIKTPQSGTSVGDRQPLTEIDPRTCGRLLLHCDRTYKLNSKFRKHE
jgi:hypothetical protein